MAWVAMRSPALWQAATVRRNRSMSGHIAARPPPSSSGSSSQAVPVSMTPSSMSLTPPADQRRPRWRGPRRMASTASSSVSGPIQ